MVILSRLPRGGVIRPLWGILQIAIVVEDPRRCYTPVVICMDKGICPTWPPISMKEPCLIFCGLSRDKVVLAAKLIEPRKPDSPGRRHGRLLDPQDNELGFQDLQPRDR
jgi:hypothetical protein